MRKTRAYVIRKRIIGLHMRLIHLGFSFQLMIVIFIISVSCKIVILLLLYCFTSYIKNK